MTIKAIIPNSTYEYVLRSQRNEANPIRWTLKTLTAKEDALIEEALVRFNESRSTFEAVSTALGFGLVGVDGLEYPDGTPFVLERTDKGGLSEKSLNSIPKDIRTELMIAIVEGQKLTEEEQKNS